MATKKMTASRRGMLEQLIKEPGSYAEYYPPLKWALENGYAIKRSGRYRETFEITKAGRDALDLQ